MNVCIDCRMINSSGIGTYIKNILPFILENFNNDFFYLLGDEEEILKTAIGKYKNIQIIEFTAPIYSIKEQLLYQKYIPKNISLFWSPHYNFPVLYRGNLLVSIMDLGHLALRQINSEIQKKIYAKFMFQQIRRRADSIIYISDFSKNEFNKYVGKPKGEEFVTLLGVDSAWFNIPEKISIFDKKYILYVGNVKPHKNLGRLIEAFKEISDQIDHYLVIVGKNKGFITGDDTLNNKIKGLEKRIIFTGEVSDDELKQYVKQANIFAFPSLYEGFGLPPLEAMAAGTPVVSSINASMPEVCGKAAIYFDPKNVSEISNKILNIIIDTKSRNSQIAIGKKQAKIYSWEKTADSTIKIINKTIIGKEK